MTKKKEEMQSEIFINSNDGKNFKKKVNFFSKQKIPIHIKLKNGKWFNGDVILIEIDMFIIGDFKRGEVPVMFEELDHIEKYKLKEV